MNKRIILIFLLASAMPYAAFGQSPRRKKFHLPDFASINVGYASSLFHVQQGTVAVNFPYLSTTADNTTTSHVFARTVKNPFPSSLQLFEASFQIGNAHRFVDMHFAGNNANQQTMMAGYGLRFQAPFASKTTFLKLAVDFGFSMAARQLGTIDNENVTLTVLGKTARPTYKFSHYKTYGRYHSSYNARNLDVTLFQTDWMFAPSFAVECHPFQNSFHFEVFSTYFISVDSRARIIMFQQPKGKKPAYPIGKFPFGANYLQVQYNGDVITHSPFHFNGLVVGIRIGFSTFIKGEHAKQKFPPIIKPRTAGGIE